jgi:hypothetical protein
MGFTTTGYREQAAKYVREEKEKEEIKIQITGQEREVSIVVVLVLIYRTKYSILRRGDAVTQLL